MLLLGHRFSVIKKKALFKYVIVFVYLTLMHPSQPSILHGVPKTGGFQCFTYNHKSYLTEYGQRDCGQCGRVNTLILTM